VKIISRYVLKEHVGPFVFALSALTSLLLLQYIARRFGDLVGKGLSWQVITEFFLLSIPFTIAMTLPMAVLVAVLYAFSRLASENEITALKAGGVSARRLMRPALIASVFVAIAMLWFNDQILSRANHELATLQVAILRTKPSFALKEQVINTVKEGQLYLRAGTIDRDQSGRMRDITIYDVSDAARRRTIYADSGTLSFASNKRDLVMHLFKGWMLSAPTGQSDQLNRIYYRQDALKVRDVANSFQSINADTASKGEREMTVCEMQKEYESAVLAERHARYDSLLAEWRLADTRGHHLRQPSPVVPTKVNGIGAIYCTFITKYFHVPAAQAAEVPRNGQDTTSRKTRDSTSRKTQDTTSRKAQDTAAKKQDTTKKTAKTADSVTVSDGPAARKVAPDKNPAAATPGAPTPGAPTPAVQAPVVLPPGAQSPGTQQPVNRPFLPIQQRPVESSASMRPPSAGPTPGVPAPSSGFNALGNAEVGDAKIRLDDARHRRNRFGVEIQKKFSLAAACIIFVLVGAPIALRFPRGGVGLVIGVSFLVFAIYYIGLIGGESLANKNIVSPFWAMWVDNVVFLIVGLVLISRMGHEAVTSRGGGLGEFMDKTRAWFSRMGVRRQLPERKHA
jgi:lipopolysaccharide export system permease protein